MTIKWQQKWLPEQESVASGAAWPLVIWGETFDAGKVVHPEVELQREKFQLDFFKSDYFKLLFYKCLY